MKTGIMTVQTISHLFIGFGVWMRASGVLFIYGQALIQQPPRYFFANSFFDLASPTSIDQSANDS
ncbi:MAG TPA: hypothetical protein VHN12_04915, partial [Geobacteraceae bacterium]|nr:hypothetical protein [Geobacteraceae bacterium]